MANKALMDALMREKTRLKAASGVLTNMSVGRHMIDFGEFTGLIALVHMNQFSNMMLRCEFTVLMAMSAEGKKVEEEEFFRRVIAQVRFEIRQLEQSLDVQIDDDGRVHQSNKPKLLRPGSPGLPN